MFVLKGKLWIHETMTKWWYKTKFAQSMIKLLAYYVFYTACSRDTGNLPRKRKFEGVFIFLTCAVIPACARALSTQVQPHTCTHCNCRNLIIREGGCCFDRFLSEPNLECLANHPSLGLIQGICRIPSLLNNASIILGSKKFDHWSVGLQPVHICM